MARKGSLGAAGRRLPVGAEGYQVRLRPCDPDDWCEGKAGGLSELDASTSSAYYYDAEAQKLYLKILSDG